MKIVLKIGGSIAFDSSGPRIGCMKRLVPAVKKLKERHKLAVAIGGGRFVRNYMAQLHGFTARQREIVAIELLRANVRMLSIALDMKPAFSLAEVEWNSVIGGIKPGQSTDANAAMAARKLGADMLVKMTNVAGIYDKDPNKFKGAKLVKHMNFSQLENYGIKGKPGSYGILESKAMKTIKSSRIKTAVIDGRNPENILKLMRSQIGTIIEEGKTRA